MKNKRHVAEETPKMERIRTGTIREHFEHQDYPLQKLSDHHEYICGGCDTPGVGTRYRCGACNFDLHEYCSYCPNNLSSFMHPHDLLLVTSDHLETRRSCVVCLEPLNGFHYTCRLCDNFDVHPLCTQLPEELRHVVDDRHPLRLRPLTSPGSCVVCKTDCSLWCYGCDICGVSIHLQCLLAPYVSSDADSSQEPPPMPPLQQNQPIPSSWQTGSSREIPFAPPIWSSQPPPQPCTSTNGAFSYGYGVPYYGVPYGYDYGYGGYSYGSSVGPPYYYANHQQSEAGTSISSTSSRGNLAKSMFSLVGDLTTSVLSNVVLGSLGIPSFF